MPIHITSKWFHGILSKVETYFPPDAFKIIKVTIDANFASLKINFIYLNLTSHQCSINIQQSVCIILYDCPLNAIVNIYFPIHMLQKCKKKKKITDKIKKSCFKGILIQRWQDFKTF